MKSIVICFIVISCCIQLSAQNYQEVYPPEHIKTVQLFNPQTNDHTPIIKLGGEYLNFSFDDLNTGFTTYNYSIEHRNADWSASNAFLSEYMDGFKSNYIRDYRNSFNIYQRYTHYQLQIPNQDMRFKLAGNYVLKVYTKDANKPVLTKRFAVYRDDVNVGITIDRYLGRDNKLNQRMGAVVSTSRYDLGEAADAAYLFVMKNNNWEDKLEGIQPQFIRNTQLTYNAQSYLFEGGSEYNWFDTKNIDVPSLNTERTYKKDSIYHTVLRMDYPRLNAAYDDTPDINGDYYIRSSRVGSELQAATEGDYSWVHFALKDTDILEPTDEVYIVGAFNNWKLTTENKMTKTDKEYTVSILLKQGYYNYQYAVKKKAGGAVSLSAINGSFWQSENMYQGLFYYRPWGTRYDLLLGYGEANSRK